MSKSKSTPPGLNRLLKPTLIHFTWSAEKPSSSATAYATADSKPLPLLGSLSTNHGSKAGESVPIVSTPSLFSGSSSVAHSSAAATSPVLSSASSSGEQAANVTVRRAAETSGSRRVRRRRMTGS